MDIGKALTLHITMSNRSIKLHRRRLKYKIFDNEELIVCSPYYRWIQKQCSWNKGSTENYNQVGTDKEDNIWTQIKRFIAKSKFVDSTGLISSERSSCSHSALWLSSSGHFLRTHRSLITTLGINAMMTLVTMITVMTKITKIPWNVKIIKSLH